jgi:hypothetical protein
LLGHDAKPHPGKSSQEMLLRGRIPETRSGR